MHTNRYTIVFALVVCVSCSVLLALAAGTLRPTIQQNMEFDIHKNILKAVGLLGSNDTRSVSELERLYTEKIQGIVVDASGNVVPGKTPSDLDSEKDDGLFPVYVREENGHVEAYCIPVSGKGLWSTIYGYMALEKDATTVKGVTFYKHGETPGLGGEIEQTWFTSNFKGKSIFDKQGHLTPIRVFKGKIPPGLSAEKKAHTVDGISGATLTGKGVTLFLKKDLEKYEPYLKRIRSKWLETGGEV